MFTFLRLIQLTSTWYDPCGSTGQESSVLKRNHGNNPSELSSVGRDIAYYMQGLGSNPRHPTSPQLNCVNSNH